ncbi:hypothetical protein VTK56DRAFT_2161 [Thermocarpiscus australiensis]
MMAPPTTTHAADQRRWSYRSKLFLFLLLGALPFLRLCPFTADLQTTRQLISIPRLWAMASGITSLEAESAPLPHHDFPAAGDGASVKGQKQLIDSGLQEKADEEVASKKGHRSHKRPAFRIDPMLLVTDLPREHIPSCPSASPTDEPGGDGKKEKGRRLVFVGDVHGNLAPLKKLLRKIGFDNKHGDHLVLTGDMITKGPDSRGVVQLAMDLGASAVRGNHEDRVLAAAREMHRVAADDESAASSASASGSGADDNSDEGETVSRAKDHARAVARSLSRSQLAWLKSLPIILRIGHIPDASSPPWNAGDIAVVHAGLVPGLPLENQDPWAAMNMRSLVYRSKDNHKDDRRKDTTSDADSSSIDEITEEMDGLATEAALSPDAIAVPIDSRKGEPWSHAWNRHQNDLPNPQSRTVAIYGHNAKAGLQVDPDVDISPPPHKPGRHTSTSSSSSTGTTHEQKEKKKKKKKEKNKKRGLRYAFGLDSGCGHGKQLTALIVEARPGAIAHRIEQVDCSHASGKEEEGGGEEGESERETEEEDLVVVDLR